MIEDILQVLQYKHLLWDNFCLSGFYNWDNAAKSLNTALKARVDFGYILERCDIVISKNPILNNFCEPLYLDIKLGYPLSRLDLEALCGVDVNVFSLYECDYTRDFMRELAKIKPAKLTGCIAGNLIEYQKGKWVNKTPKEILKMLKEFGEQK